MRHSRKRTARRRPGALRDRRSVQRAGWLVRRPAGGPRNKAAAGGGNPNDAVDRRGQADRSAPVYVSVQGTFVRRFGLLVILGIRRSVRAVGVPMRNVAVTEGGAVMCVDLDYRRTCADDGHANQRKNHLAGTFADCGQAPHHEPTVPELNFQFKCLCRSLAIRRYTPGPRWGRVRAMRTRCSTAGAMRGGGSDLPGISGKIALAVFRPAGRQTG